MDDIDGDETSRREEDLEGREIILIVEAVKRVIRVIRSMTCAKEKFKRGVVCILLEDETRFVLEQNIFPFTIIFEIFINFKSRLRELSNFPK